jgi:hypothetical protein
MMPTNNPIPLCALSGPLDRGGGQGGEGPAAQPSPRLVLLLWEDEWTDPGYSGCVGGEPLVDSWLLSVLGQEALVQVT